jgi:SAM-dependent methyltransferase
MSMARLDSNNPFHQTAESYDEHLSRPFISSIRRQEAQAVQDLIAAFARPEDTALEIGPGTGFYTTMLAPRLRHVTAVEDSRTMADLLSRRLDAEGIGNVSVLHADFRTLPAPEGFDLVMAFGVLDYIPEPEAFIARMCALARRAVLITVPQRGLWGSCFAVSNRLRRISVFCHTEEALARWAPGWRCSVTEVGLKTPLTKGLTLVVALEPGPAQ